MAKVTETDNELARRVERLSILYEISRSASSITGLDQLLINITKQVSAAMNDAPGILGKRSGITGYGCAENRTMLILLR